MSKLMDKIEGIKKTDLNCNVFSVYDYCGLTIQDLLNQFFTKINECIEISNKTIDLAQWLVDEGLKLEVALKFDQWLQDGTFQEIINDKIFKELNEKVTKNSGDILLLQDEFTDIKTGFENMKIENQEIKQELNDININLEGMGRTFADHDERITKNKNDIIAVNERIDGLQTGGVASDLPIKEINIDANVLGTQDLINQLNETSIENNRRNILRIGTYNILSFKYKNVAKTTQAGYMMLKSKLDICGMQEMLTYFDFESRWWIKIPGAYDHVEFNHLFNVPGGKAGQGMLSHHKMTNVVYGKYTPVEGYEPRGYLKASIVINGKTINVYNTHLTHNNMTMLRSEMEQLANIVEADTNPYKIVVGDFNTRTESDYKPFTDLGFTLSYPISSGTIDNILCPSNMRVVSVEKVKTENNISDHDMIVAELEVL